MNSAYPLAVVLAQFLETNLDQEVLLPAFNTSIHADRNVSLLANGAAETPSLRACRQMRQGVGQIVEFACCKQLRGHVVLEPKDLGHLHLDTHLSADIAEKIVIGAIDLLHFIDRTMIEPENHIPLFLPEAGRDRDRLIGIEREDGERTGCIESDAFDTPRIDGFLLHCFLDRVAYAVPDIRCGLLIVIVLVVPELNVLTCQSLDVAILIDYTRTCATRPHIDPDIMTVGHGVSLFEITGYEWNTIDERFLMPRKEAVESQSSEVAKLVL